jgi:hypothetical protein
MHRRVASPEQAAALVPFTVFAPRAREGWVCQHAAVHPADERTHRPASATLQFAGDREESQLVVHQRAADGGEPPATPDGSDWRIEHVDGREVRLWDPGDGQRGYPRIAVLERGGTQIQLMAHGVEAGVLPALAGDLAPVEPAGIRE